MSGTAQDNPWAAPNGAVHRETQPVHVTASFPPRRGVELRLIELVSDRNGAFQPFPCCAAISTGKGYMRETSAARVIWTGLQTRAAKANSSFQNYPA